MRRTIGAWLVGAVVVSGCATPRTAEGPREGAAPPAGEAVRQAKAELVARSYSTLSGTAEFTEDAQGRVNLVLEIAGAPPGKHAVHLHEKGDCSAPDATSAGGHWNPTGEPHGRWSQSSHHLGDIGNLEVRADGAGTLTLSTDRWSIGSGEDHDIVGKALIVHADRDDFETQPTGDAGGRIGCGVVTLEE